MTYEVSSLMSTLALSHEMLAGVAAPKLVNVHKLGRLHGMAAEEVGTTASSVFSEALLQWTFTVIVESVKGAPEASRPKSAKQPWPRMLNTGGP